MATQGQLFGAGLDRTPPIGRLTTQRIWAQLSAYLMITYDVTNPERLANYNQLTR